MEEFQEPASYADSNTDSYQASHAHSVVQRLVGVT